MLRDAMFTMALGVGGLLMAGSVLAEPVAKQYQANLSRSSCESLARGADFLASAQVESHDGLVGWSWQAGVEAMAPNQAGLVSLSLLDAYDALGDVSYLHAAERYGEALVDACRRDREGLFAYKPDIEFLGRLGKLQAEPSYTEAAQDLFLHQLSRSPLGADEIARIAEGRKSRPSLLGFDGALAIRAALAVGERAYAYQLADALVARSAQWYRPTKDLRFSLISSAALVPALEQLDAAHYAGLVARFRADLARLQAAEGSWLSNESQVTAYAVMALAKSPLADQRDAAERGAAWLKSTALKAGSFATFNDYMPEPFVGEVLHEVSAEALNALALACRAEHPRAN